MDVTIHRTTIAPTADGTYVQLYISDAPVEAETAKTVVQITVSLPKYAEALFFEQAQREAMQAVQQILSEHLQRLAGKIQGTDVRLRPKILESE